MTGSPTARQTSTPILPERGAQDVAPRSASDAIAPTVATAAAGGLAALGLTTAAGKSLGRNRVRGITAPGAMEDFVKLREAIESQRSLRPGSKPVAIAGAAGPAFLDHRGRLAQKLSTEQLQRILGVKDPMKYTDAVRQGTRGMIGIDYHDATALAHEFGHATGTQNLRKLMGVVGTLRLQGAGTLAGLASTAKAYNARSDEDIERGRRWNRNTAAARLLASAPTLMEEARASIRGHRLMKKMINKGADKRALAAAFGTYAARALTPTLVTYGVNRAILNHRADEARLRLKYGGGGRDNQG